MPPDSPFPRYFEEISLLSSVLRLSFCKHWPLRSRQSGLVLVKITHTSVQRGERGMILEPLSEK